MLIQNETCIFKTTNIHCATNEDTATAKGTPMFPAILVTGHLFICNSEELYLSALESNSNFTPLLPLSSATSKGIIRKEEQRYLNWNRVFCSRFVVNILSVAKVLVQ